MSKDEPRSRRLSYSRRVRVGVQFAFLGLVVALGLGAPRHVAGHPELARTDPPADGLLAAPPQRIDLWTTEAVDVGGGSPSLRVLDQTGREARVRNLAVDPADATHFGADVVGIGTGTYTVLWSARSSVDGHTLSGTFAFRVGGGRAPGAATVEGEIPPVWAVATRWLTFLGAALAAGGFFSMVAIAPGAGDQEAQRRLVAIVMGLVLALLASLAEPVLQTWWPPAGALAPSLGEAIQGLPAAWWLRPAALGLTLALAAVLLARARRGQPIRRTTEWAGLALALVALLGLSLTSHAAARETWRAAALISDVLHQWTVALWVGGLAHLALAWPSRRPLTEPPADGPTAVLDPVRRFSRLALGLILIGVGTGVVNAGLVLPTLASLWSSPYGDVLLLKVAVLVASLLLATFNRLALRRAVERVAGALWTTVRAEAALVLLVALGGSVLALLAPPIVVATTPLDLAAPIEANPDDALLHLRIHPAQPGENTLAVFVTDASGAPQPLQEASLVRLHITNLDHGVDADAIEVRPNATGEYIIEGAQLSLTGWWRVVVVLRRAGESDVRVPFYLVLPDPNLNGLDAPPTPPSSDEAEAVFRRGLTHMTSLHRVRYARSLASGMGTVFTSEEAVSDGSDGRPPASMLSADQVSIVRIGEREWLRQSGQGWTERQASPIIPPSAWGEEYAGATGFRLGLIEEVAGEPAQVVTFVVPETPRLAGAWYAWWVGVDSGQVLRQAMVSRWHYMVLEYRDFDAPLTIEPPVDADPVGTPLASSRAASLR